MFRHKTLALAAAMACSLPPLAQGADGTDLQQIRNEIDQLRAAYDARIQDLEARLKRAEAAVQAAQTAAPQPAEDKPAQSAAPAAPTAVATAAPVASAPAGAGAFNPAISLILSGTYSNLSQDPTRYRITGFIPGGEIGPGERSFNLGESELGVYANIDPYFYGGLNLALAPDDTVSVEEAFIQTLGLSHGLTIKAGRFFSGIGYLNEQHAHTWDFVDNPLAYQAFLGTQLGDDGVQVKWLAPIDTYLELGAEIGRGRSFPSTSRNKNGIGAASVFAHTGGDIGVSANWRAGLSYLQTSPQDREYQDNNLAGDEVTNAFSGRSRLWIADFVYKWAPNGNAQRTNLKVQGEYFYRRERGTLAYDTAAVDLADAYSSRQSGWYLQSLYQFIPMWRVGLRYDRLDSGTVDYASNGAFLAPAGYDPSRISTVLEWAPSEFSRIRLQLARDKAREGATDNQLFLQYQTSLGAHGAHSY